MVEERQVNEGEGNRTAARTYNQQTRKFVEHTDVAHQARKAAEALASEEGASLREAEEQGRKRAKDEDPQIRRQR